MGENKCLLSVLWCRVGVQPHADTRGHFRGPWIENLWCDLHLKPRQFFGPYFPIFVPWTDIFVVRVFEQAVACFIYDVNIAIVRPKEKDSI